MSSSQWDWSTTAGSNTTVGGVSIAEGMNPANVNNAMRAIMAGLKNSMWGGTSGGTANAQTVSLGNAPAAYVAGMAIWFLAGSTNTGATTLNVNSLGTKNVFAANAAMIGGEILSGELHLVVYDGTQFQLQRSGRPTRLANTESLGTGNSYTKAGVPSWATHIAITIRDLSTNGTVVPALRLGTSGGLATTGYVGNAVYILNAANPELSGGTTGFLLGSSWAAAVVVTGTIDLWLHSSGSNIWTMKYTLNREDADQIVSGAGTVGLSGALDRVGFVTTDNFDDGTVTIYYE